MAGNMAGNPHWPSLDISLSDGPACEAVRTLSYWPELFDTLIGIAAEQGEFPAMDRPDDSMYWLATRPDLGGEG